MPRNSFFPEGHWSKNSDGYYLFQTPESGVTIHGLTFHMLAIQTTGESLQVAKHPENQRELDALHTAGGSCAGYQEIEVDGHPAVVFLVPHDR